MKEVSYKATQAEVDNVIRVMSFAARQDKKKYIDLVHYEYVGSDEYKITTETEACVHLLSEVIGLIPEKKHELDWEINKDLIDDCDDLRFVSF